MAVETPEYAQFVRRIIRAYSKRVASADEIDLAEMDEVRREFEDLQRLAIHALRAQGRSWTYIAAGLGVSRQAARQRWS